MQEQVVCHSSALFRGGSVSFFFYLLGHTENILFSGILLELLERSSNIFQVTAIWRVEFLVTPSEVSWLFRVLQALA